MKIRNALCVAFIALMGFGCTEPRDPFKTALRDLGAFVQEAERHKRVVPPNMIEDQKVREIAEAHAAFVVDTSGVVAFLLAREKEMKSLFERLRKSARPNDVHYMDSLYVLAVACHGLKAYGINVEEEDQCNYVRQLASGDKILMSSWFLENYPELWMNSEYREKLGKDLIRESMRMALQEAVAECGVTKMPETNL